MAAVDSNVARLLLSSEIGEMDEESDQDDCSTDDESEQEFSPPACSTENRNECFYFTIINWGKC